MSIYDTYGDQQLKIDPTGQAYRVGEKSPLLDGIYISDSAAIVIYDGFFIAQLPLTDKWGNRLDCDKIVRDNNPVGKAVNDVMSYFEDKDAQRPDELDHWHNEGGQ